jgi:hypothetical protein
LSEQTARAHARQIKFYLEEKMFCKKIILVLLVILSCTRAFYANAASLNYSNNTNIYLSTPAITLVIQSSSAADGLTVNATNLVVTMSTGETFTLISPQSLSYTTTGSGGALSQTCSSGTETVVITQTSSSETYTLTLTGSACVVAAPPSSGGGGGGGGGYYYTPTLSTPAATPNIVSTKTAPSSSLTPTTPISSTFTFTKPLYLGLRDPDVLQLQKLLAHYKTIYPSGKITGYYWLLTEQAVGKYQILNGIVKNSYSKGYGMVGIKTRAFLNALLKTVK